MIKKTKKVSGKTKSNFQKILFPGLILLFFLTSCGQDAPEETNEEPTRPVVTATAQKRDLSSKRTVTAPVIAYKRVYITARISGQVLELPFEEGDRVGEGQLLARLDTRRQQAQLRQAEANYEEARKNFERSQKLYEEEVISPADFEMAVQRLETTQSEVEFWKAEVEYGDIHSPINAVVADKLVEIGTTVSENERLFTIEDHDLLVVRPGVPETDVAHLEKGQEVDMKFDVFPGESFTGVVRRIFPSADAITRLFTVEVEVDQRQASRPVRPGYLARIHFVTDDRTDVLAIPPEAISRRNETTHVFVISDDEAKVSKRTVETGVERDGWIQVISGLEEGEKVAAGNLDPLDDGIKIREVGTFRRYGFRE